MKKLLLISCTALTLLTNVATFADTTTTTTAAPANAMMGGPAMAPGGPGADMKNSPGHQACKHIFMACKEAGYYRGGASSGKGIMENCAQPIMSGQAVANVKVDPSDVATCKSVHNHNMPQ